MGAQKSRPSYDQWDMQALAIATGVPQSQIEEIYRDYFKVAGKDGRVSKREFTQFFKKFPASEQSKNSRDLKQQIDRIFRTYDRDGSNALSFEEFLGAVILMNHDMPRRDRIDFLIRQNNGSVGDQGNGQISAEYGQQVLEDLNGYYGLPPRAASQTWQEIDPENRGFASHDEVMNYIDQQEAYNRPFQA